MGIADGVRAALGDAGQQRLRRERPLDARSGLRLYPAIPHMLDKS